MKEISRNWVRALEKTVRVLKQNPESRQIIEAHLKAMTEVPKNELNL